MRLEKACVISVIALLVVGISLAIAGAQTLHDQVTVSLPYPVTVGEKIVRPGEYRIRQVADTKVRIIKTEGGSQPIRIEAEVVRRIATFDEPAKETKVVLHRFGNDYYFDKIWMQGRGDYYEFVLPQTAKSRERERQNPAEVSANHEQVSADSTTAGHGENGAPSVAAKVAE